MAATVDVPLNTVIADLDEALRRLLRRRARATRVRGRRDRVRRAVEGLVGQAHQPERRPVPLRPARSHRARLDVADRAPRQRPRLDVPPAAAARTDLRRDRLDEGRRGRAPAALPGALDPVLAPPLPADLLAEGTFGSADGLADAETSVGRPREEKADFWSAVGGQYKASIDFVVHLVVESGASTERGPEVRTQTFADAARRRPGADAHRAAPASAARCATPRASPWRTPGLRSRRSGAGAPRTRPGGSASSGCRRARIGSWRARRRAGRRRASTRCPAIAADLTLKKK